MEIQTMRNRLPGNVMRLCIDAGHAYDVSGRLYSRTTGICLRFASMAELLLKTDALLDEIGSPQAFQRKRIFSTGKSKEMTDIRITTGQPSGTDCVIEEQMGKYTTFELAIQSRMHASWQGFLAECDGTVRGSFESELQLMEMILGSFTADKHSPASSAQS